MKRVLPALILAGAAACDRPPKPPVNTTAEQAVVKEAAPVLKRRIIDTHVHMNAQAYRLLLKQLQPLGLERIVNMSGGSSAEIRAENIAAADSNDDRVLLFHNIDWDTIDDPDFGEAEAARLRESVKLGFAGVKVSKALGLGVRTADGNLVTVDDPRLDPIWATAGELGVPIAIHTSDPKAFFEPPTPDNERYGELSLAPGWSFYGDQFPSRAELLAARDRLVAKHPGTTFILLHLGNNPEDPKYVDRLLSEHPNAYVDVAARIGEFGRHPASEMKAFFEKHSERVFFATDMMMGVVAGPLGQPRLRLTLGSISPEPPGIDDIAPFYAKHFEYFESNAAEIDHPVPIQGPWKVHPIGLETDVREKLYWRNAERVIVAPWLGRRSAQRVAARATAFAAPR